jgi:hypothetical protein
MILKKTLQEGMMKIKIDKTILENDRKLTIVIIGLIGIVLIQNSI